MANTLTEPAVSACPDWCRLPSGHGWDARGYIECGDWGRMHDRIIGDWGVSVQQLEVRDDDGRMKREPALVFSEFDRDNHMTPDEALALAAELERRAASVRQAAELARRVSA